MLARHKKSLALILRTYGTAEVVKAISEITAEEAKSYDEGAVIHQYLPIVNEAADRLSGVRLGRFMAQLSS